MESKIHLWTVPIDKKSVNLPLWYIDFFDAYEKDRYRQLKNEIARTQFLVSHVLLREALTFTVNSEVEPYNWEFTENEFGKPKLVSKTDSPCLHFNLAHCKRLAVVTVSRKGPIGVDVEKLTYNIHSSLIKDILSVEEQKWFKSRSPATKAKIFFQIWTIKEAYSKMLGKGFSLNFKSFDVALNPVRMIRTETGISQPDDLYLETCEIKISNAFFYISIAAKILQVKKPKILLHTLESPLIKTY